jgi:hypothetical protein
MVDIQLLNFAVDMCLMFSLVFCVVRFVALGRMSGGASKQMEASIARLIGEAERAGKDLSKELERRQRSLESALTEIESAETRIQRTIVSADQNKKLLEEVLVQARKRSAPASTATVVSAPAPTARPVAAPVRQSAPVPMIELEQVDDSETEERNSSNWGNVNIFGDPIPGGAAEVVAPSGSPLQRAVRVEREAAPSRNGYHATPNRVSPQQSIERVYDEAEDLLRAGEDLAAVSARTKLSMPEVRMLSEMVEKERIVKEDREPSVEVLAAKPPARLGGLAGMRRTVQTV